ncbi:MAG: Unknown protein [uncultured Thiotrichaceae bacterium]|uniref:DUF6933 domain-containing protein n=1 Tax=uncultured Thiotrichaceae bacterium TaxID=298394 RepID=A0A6S6SDT3_9GAMM|nr:MAG: Unknown protein [uncultured Thiotrichaceae bacterium]
MLILNGTKDFSALMKERVRKAPNKSISLDPVSDMQWVCHVVKIKRKNCVITMEVQTRYCMVFIDVKKADAAHFPQRFIKRLATEMSLMHDSPMGHFERNMKVLAKHHAKTLICKRNHRSVQSHINDVVWHLQNHAKNTGALPATPKEVVNFGVFVNKQLRSTKAMPDYFYPYERMQEQWSKWFPELELAPISEVGVAKAIDEKFTKKATLMSYTKQTLH